MKELILELFFLVCFFILNNSIEKHYGGVTSTVAKSILKEEKNILGKCVGLFVYFLQKCAIGFLFFHILYLLFK